MVEGHGVAVHMETAMMAIQVTGNRRAQLLDMAWKCHVPTHYISASLLLILYIAIP